METVSMRKKLRVLALTAAGFCPAAQAEVTDNNFYLGLGLGLAHMEPETDDTGYSIDQGKDLGFKVFAGHDFSKRISGELFYADLGRVTLDPRGEIEYQDIAVSGLYYFYQPESGQGVRAFARGGVGHMTNSANVPYTNDHEYHFTYGAGLEYGLSNGYAVRVEADLFDKDAQLVTVGLLKRFGKKSEPVVTDRDGDGVPDAQDQCPGSAPGVRVDAAGCRLNPDLDGDGVPNEQDQCPNTAPGENVDAVGCRVDPDLDGDGVLNEQDGCPHTAPGTKVDASGCPLKERIVLKGVVFELNSDALAGSSHDTLDEVAKTLKRYPEMKVQIAGYTDSQGSEAYNQRLSQRRADAVRRYLIEQGVSSENLTARGYGEDNPIAGNGTAEGRALNRRVEMHRLK